MSRRSFACIFVGGLLLAALTLVGCGSPQGAGPLSTPPSQTSNTPVLPATSPASATSALTPQPSPTRPAAATAAAKALQVAYVKEGNAWLWREGAQAVQLSKDGGVSDVKISPDGAIVAFARGGELWAIHSDGTQERRLVSTADLAGVAANATVKQFAWQPGSHKLAYNTWKGSRFGTDNYDLHQIDADSLAKRTLLAPGQGGDFFYSPDGSRIAVIGADKLSLVNADGSNRRDALTYNAARGKGGYPKPIWAADGRYLIAAAPSAESAAQAPQETTIWRIPADGSAGTSIAKIRGPYPSQIAVSPDLAYIAYLQQPTDGVIMGGPGPALPLVITAVGKDEIAVYAQEARQLYGWAPDSRHMAFGVGPMGEEMMIGQPGAQAIPASDNAAVTVTDLRWVDAGRYLFVYYGPQGTDLVLRKIGGTDQVIATVDSEWAQAYDLSKG